MKAIAAPKLRWVAHAAVEVGTPIPLHSTPDGQHRLVPVHGGRVVGEWRWVILGGGADWQTVHEDGSVGIDARYPVRLEDGSTVCFIARGVRPSGSLEGEFTTSLMLQGDAPANLSATVYLAVGHKTTDAVEFDIFEVA
jgi:Protein of unknown function (DUF3237)